MLDTLSVQRIEKFSTILLIKTLEMNFLISIANGVKCNNLYFFSICSLCKIGLGRHFTIY